MADRSQTVTSQQRLTENNKEGALNRSPGKKPPLLPKPQFAVNDLKNGKYSPVRKIQNSSQTIISVVHGRDAVSKEETIILNNINIADSAGGKGFGKPPALYPKPKLPPKSSAFRTARSVQGNCPSGENDAPVRPPRSPKKVFKDNPLEEFQNRLLCERPEPTFGFIEQRQKSASLPRNEFANWSQLPEEKSPPVLPPTPRPRSKNRSKFHLELDLATPPEVQCPVYATVDYSKKRNRQNNPSRFAGDEPVNRGVFRREGAENSPLAGVPQSFLHRFVSSSARTKEETGEQQQQQKTESGPNNTSFLHKHNGRTLSSYRNEGSFEIVTFQDVDSDVSRNAEQPTGRESETKDYTETSPRTSTCSEEGSNLGKRFPWFGSFGKGNKKRSEKKERCSSQFYATPITLQEDGNMNDCSRTKSLPNIKSNVSDKTADSDEHSDWNGRNTDSLNSEFSTLTHNSDGEDDKDSVNDVEVDAGRKANKAFLIAKELMTSEEVFIDVLKLLNVDFRNFVEIRNKDKNSVIPQSNLNKILNHLPELQTLNEVLLADLKKRILNWETNPKISDVIVKKGAFLKLYTSYIQNFESQTKYLDDCVAKYPKFGKVLKEFESLERCKMLTLKHYMLKPVQRIPQYRLLLSDYLKHIDDSSPDYEDTETALKIVSEVADHVNRNLKYGDKSGTLMHFQSLLSDYELIRPGRELIKDGPLEKICRKSVKDRYFILLNDCLLHTTYSKNSLKIHQELPLAGMKVCCNDEQNNRYCFTVYSTTRSFILCAKSETERNDWVQSLQSAIEQYISRQKTFMNVKIPETNAFKIGKEAPVWIQDSKVTMCQICTAEFTSLFRRHHCRACGKVICKNCGGSQAPLQYDSFKPHRVCDQCFPILLKDYEDSEDEIYEILKINNSGSNVDIQNIYLNNKTKFIKYTSTCKPKFIPPRLKEVSANDADSEMSGVLYRKSRKAWKQYWYVLKEHVLFIFRASEDVRALETIPVLGYEVKHSDVNLENVDKNLIFILEHPHQSPIIFHAETEETAERWYKALKRATLIENLGHELPDSYDELLQSY
ncbi:UNVERIFIED_CONTAM: hypothetical protein PYX00_010121 [Menopon gallinae]|uniref:FYVE, RhoGEF and PH domain-containing protein 4 n=1 Tax=Menopon gallinae TaxID=328185 RepID=A0AAW2HEJ1_9NEOP